MGGVTRLTQQVADAFLPSPPPVLGVAVSGGGDSIALLHLMHGLCTAHGTRLRAVTVNHGLRAEAADEACEVERYCASIGVPHDTLLWDEWDGKGNLQNVARIARYQRMAAWAREHGLDTIALGHTADDQAETVLMRLARRSGVNGLSGMRSRVLREGVTWVRPLLRSSREDLREYLRVCRIGWAEDPSNEDLTYDRIKARRALVLLADLGIDATGLCMVAEQMAEARRALDWQTFLAAKDLACVYAGAIVLSERKLRILPDEIQRRLLVHAVNWVSGTAYPARRAAVTNLMTALRKGQGGTADGVQARRIGRYIWVFRELDAVRQVETPPDRLWDDRWRFEARAADAATRAADLRVRALGETGLQQCPNWRETKLPHAVLLSTPAIWRGDEVVSAPLAGFGQTWHADVEDGEDTFFAALLTH